MDITTAQSFSFASVEILNGTLSGAGSVNVTITASMSWDQGTISGLGTLTIASGATLSLGGPQRSIERLGWHDPGQCRNGELDGSSTPTG